MEELYDKVNKQLNKIENRISEIIDAYLKTKYLEAKQSYLESGSIYETTVPDLTG